MRRLILLGISFLFLTTCVSSSSIGINKNFNNDIIQNSEIKPLDNNREIITFIGCWGNPLNVTFKGKLYFEMWEDEGIPIKGYRYTLLPPRVSKFSETCKHVIAPCFILFDYYVHYGSCFVIGIALGNIQCWN